jgi:hypothetical protein
MRATVYLHLDSDDTSPPRARTFQSECDGGYWITLDFETVNISLPGRDMVSVGYARALAAELTEAANQVEAAIGVGVAR